METVTPELEKHARAIKEQGFPMKKNNPELEVSSESESDMSDSESDSDYAPKKKSHKKQIPTGMDMIYIDNQNLWKKLAKVKGELNIVEERLRYLQLEHNNKVVDIADQKETISNLKNEIKVQKTQYSQITKAKKYTVYQRNILALFWILSVIFHFTSNHIDIFQKIS